MESIPADPVYMFRSPFPSRHLTAAQDVRVQEQIRFSERDYVSYVISGSRTEIEYEDVSVDTTDFIQGSLTSSLVFSAKIGGIADDPVSTWFVFHHKDHDNHAVDFFRWVLSGYGYAIESDITSLVLRIQASERTRGMQTICGRAYARSICYRNYWSLYPRLVYLLYLTSETINQGDVDSISGESGDEGS
jgi:hypothetical protein